MGRLLTTFKDKTFEPSMKSYFQLYTDDTSTASQIYDSLLYVRGVNAGSLAKNQEGDDDVSTVEEYDTYMPIRFYNVKSKSDGSTPTSPTHTFFNVYNRAEYAGPDGQNMYDLYADYNIAKLSGASYITNSIGGAVNYGIDGGSGDSQTIPAVYGAYNWAKSQPTGSSRTVTYLMASRNRSHLNKSDATVTYAYPTTSEFTQTTGDVGTLAMHKFDLDYTAGNITNAYFIWANESSLPTPSGEKYFIKSNISWPTLLSGSLTNTGSVTFSSTLSVASTATISGDVIIGKSASSASSGSKSLTFKGVDDNGTEIIAAKILTVDSANNPQGQDLNIQVASDNSTLFTAMQLNSVGFIGIGLTGSSIGNHLHLADNYSLGLGTGSDLTLLHNGTKSTITNSVGDLEIIQNTDDGDIIFKSDDGSGGIAEYFRVDGGNDQVEFKKDIKLDDNVKLKIGNGGDLRIYHDSSNSYIDGGNVSAAGNLIIRNRLASGDVIFQGDNGDGDGSQTTYFQLDNSMANTGNPDVYTRFPDNSRLTFGNSANANSLDLEIYHDGSDSHIKNKGGDFNIESNSGIYITNDTADEIYIEQKRDDGDIIFKCDNGSGGTTDYIQLDGSEVSIKMLTQKVIMSNLPTSNPNNAGQLYNDSGTLKVSAG
jgi:hypothetical protein